MDFLPARFLLLVALVVASPGLTRRACAESAFSLQSAGARAGFSTSTETRDFNQAEGFVDWLLPLEWDPFTKWHLHGGFEAAAGWLGGQGDDAFIATSAASVLIQRQSIPLTLDLGSGLSLLSREKFGGRDFGSIVQFTSHAGLNFDFGKHLRLGYRFQHMSNAGIGHLNPGLNLHVLAISYRF